MMTDVHLRGRTTRLETSTPRVRLQYPASCTALMRAVIPLSRCAVVLLAYRRPGRQRESPKKAGDNREGRCPSEAIAAGEALSPTSRQSQCQPLCAVTKRQRSLTAKTKTGGFETRRDGETLARTPPERCSSVDRRMRSNANVSKSMILTAIGIVISAGRREGDETRGRCSH